MRDVIDFECSKCNKSFSPVGKPDKIEYTMRGENILLVCPDCIAKEKEVWKIADCEFHAHPGVGPKLEFTRNDGANFEFISYAILGDELKCKIEGIVSPQVDEYVRKQLFELYQKHMTEKQKWQANIKIVDDFDNQHIEFESVATGKNKVRFRIVRDKLQLDPAVKLDPRIEDQIYKAWKKQTA